MSSKPIPTFALAASFAGQSVRLPLRICEIEKVVILDDHGTDVLTVDSNGCRPDAQAYAIAELIVHSVNQAAGLCACRPAGRFSGHDQPPIIGTEEAS